MNPSPRPWTITRGANTPYYVILDAEGRELARVCSYKDERKPNSWQKQIDLDLAKANADLICKLVNQG